jgi:TetR/AcrR family acrAB operon transcriptional repressor
MTPRPNVSEERKAQILDAAAAVFSREGFHQAPMADIADEAGLSKGTLYLYFESKDDLISALLEHFYREALGSLPEMVAAEGTATERLLKIGRSVVSGMQDMLQTLPLSFEFYAEAARQEQVRLFFKEYFAESYGFLSTIVEQGIERGEFRPVDPYAAALMVGAIFEGLGLLWMVNPASVDWEKHTEAIFDLLLNGLLAGEGKHGKPS